MSLIKLFINKKKEIGLWNTTKFTVKFIYSTYVREVKQINFLKYYISRYEIEHREIYKTCKENRKLIQRECPICGNDESIFFTFNATEGEYRLCQKCDLLFMSPILNKDNLSQIYTMHDCTAKKMLWQYGMKNTPRLTEQGKKLPYMIQLLKKYKIEGNLLDFGCSIGSFLNYAKFYYDVTGIEIDPITSKYAQEELGLNVYNNDIFDESLNFDKMFDIVTMLQVIEHLENPKLILEKLRRFLKDDGIIFIECPNYKSYSMKALGRFHTLILGNEHINMFSLNSINKLLRLSGFELIFSETYNLDLTLYDLIGKCFFPVHGFYHRYTYKNMVTLLLLGCPNALYTRVASHSQKNNKDYGSYLRVVAKVK